MNFRNRLIMFSTLIVILPGIAIALVLFSLAGDSERGKVDSGLATGVRVGSSLYREGQEAAKAHLRVGRDARLLAALSGEDRRAARARLGQLLRGRPRIVSASLFNPQGDRIAAAGSPRGIALVRAVLRSNRGGVTFGTLAISVTDARELVRTAAERTKLDFLVMRGERGLATTVPAVRKVGRGSSDFEAGGGEYRGRSEVVGRSGGATESLGVFTEAGGLNSNITRNRLLIGALLLAVMLLALAVALSYARGLQGQMGQFLSAARSLAGGRFDVSVPATGDDEFAQLGREFNSMSEQLEAKIGEVERKRRELEATIRRVGRAFAAGLDRQGIFELTVQTAVDACEAEAGRALPLDIEVLHEITAGSDDPQLLAALEGAERAAFSIGPEVGGELLDVLEGRPEPAEGRSPAVIQLHGVHAIALPLRARLGSRTFASYVGAVSIARRGHPFTQEEADLLQYLAGQAGISLENADLHETVQQQAITDELTRLSNVREMHGVLDREFDRQRRFETPLAFVLLDIDDFKHVNDTFGHQQGDVVLVEVANVLRALTRDIDEPVRYGGEELAVVLPQTDVEGAALLAERMREAVENLRFLPRGGREELRVTASFGVAAVPASARDKKTLFAAADAALYRAKRAGKNRVERAEPLDVADLSGLT